MDEKIRFLKATPLFGGLEDEELVELIRRLKVASYEAGEYVFVEGEPAEALFIVLAGEIELSKEIAPELERTLAVAGAGEVFGEMGVLDGAARSASARARTRTDVLWIGAELLRELVQSRPLLGAKLLWAFATLLSARLRTTTEQYGAAVRWALEASGLQRLPLHELLEGVRSHAFSLRDGTVVRGRILRVDEGPAAPLAGREITVKTDGGAIVVLPYHALLSIDLDVPLQRALEAEVL